MPTKSTDIVIVNYGTGWWLGQCLRSCFYNNGRIEYHGKDNDEFKRLLRETMKASTTTLVHNGGDDFGLSVAGSMTMHGLTIIDRSKKRIRNYSAGLNAGIKETKNKYILAMNNDIVLGKDTVEELEKFMDTHPTVAMAQPIVTDMYGIMRPETYVHIKYRCWPEVADEASYDYLNGCCLMIRRSALEEVGLFDERLMFFEDADMSYRINKVGLHNRVIPHVSIKHIGSASVAQFPWRKRIWSNRSRILFFLKHLW